LRRARHARARALVHFRRTRFYLPRRSRANGWATSLTPRNPWTWPRDGPAYLRRFETVPTCLMSGRVPQNLPLYIDALPMCNMCVGRAPGRGGVLASITFLRGDVLCSVYDRSPTQALSHAYGLDVWSASRSRGGRAGAMAGAFSRLFDTRPRVRAETLNTLRKKPQSRLCMCVCKDEKINIPRLGFRQESSRVFERSSRRERRAACVRTADDAPRDDHQEHRRQRTQRWRALIRHPWRR
jgi:hypothetical protein